MDICIRLFSAWIYLTVKLTLKLKKGIPPYTRGALKDIVRL